jgi:myosin heavy subunit
MTEQNQRERKATIVDEYIPRAFMAILQTGRQPSIDSIIEWLKENDLPGRNRNSISEGLKKCWLDLGRRTKEISTIPGLPREAQEAFIPLWNTMQDVSRREYDAFKSELLQETQNKVDVAERLAIAAEKRADTATAEVEQTTLALSSATETLAQVRVQVDQVTHRADQAEASVSTLREQKAVLETNLASLRSQLESSTVRHKQDLEREDARYNQMRQSLQNSIDQVRTEKKAVEAKLARAQDELSSLRSQMNIAAQDHLQQISKVREQLGQARGEASATALQLSKAQAEAAVAAGVIARQTDDNAAQRREVEQLGATVQALQQALSARAPVSPGQLVTIIEQAFLQGSTATPVDSQAQPDVKPSSHSAKPPQRLSPSTLAKTHAAEILKTLGMSAPEASSKSPVKK